MSVTIKEFEKDLKVHIQGPLEVGNPKCEYLNGLAYVVEPPMFNNSLVTVKFISGKYKGTTMDVPIGICFWTKQDRIRLDYKQFNKNK